MISKQHIELQRVKCELTSKTLLHCVTPNNNMQLMGYSLLQTIVSSKDTPHDNIILNIVEAKYS
jgi:hypothetical protein